jgi:acyl carrier protein
MHKEEIVHQIREFIASEFPMPGQELTSHTDLLEEWFVDSLGIVETVMFLERQFGVQLQRADINGVNFRNVEALSELVHNLLGG